MAGQRPPQIKAPPYLSKSPPRPVPGEGGESAEHGGPRGKEPTRYGDWESGGICRDF
jgi:hypothetical protein